jgi:hypothetical protein
MRKLLLISIWLCTFFEGHAADTLITKLIKSIYLEEVKPNFRYYYLIDSAVNPELDKYMIKDLSTDKPLISKEIPFSDFLVNIKTDNSPFHWADFNPEKARCVDRRHLPKYSAHIHILTYVQYNDTDSIRKLVAKNIIPVPYKRPMNKRATKRAQEQAITKYENRPVEEKNWYYFSKPIFSNDKQYVFISLGDCFNESSYVFKWVNNTWVKVIRFNTYVID